MSRAGEQHGPVLFGGELLAEREIQVRAAQGRLLRALFQSATDRILLAGFTFDRAERVLEPMHQALERAFRCRLYAVITLAQGCVKDHWSFGPPFPEVHAFNPAEGVQASLHTMCVVVDGRQVLITSANFTDRGQSRNVEGGAQMVAPGLAMALEVQFASGSWFSRVG